MSGTGTYPRLNIYLDRPDLREKVKVAAARKGVTVSSYCLAAIRQRLIDDGLLPAADEAGPRAAAQALDRLRRQIGPIGVPVRDLITAGRR